MSFIGTHDLPRLVTDSWSGKYEWAKIPERYVVIPMPWKQRAYSIKHDDMRWIRPKLHIYWHSPGHRCLSIRIGYSCVDMR